MRSAKQGGFSEQNKDCSPILQMRRLSLRDEQQASRFHSLAAVQEQKLLKDMPGGGGRPWGLYPESSHLWQDKPQLRDPLGSLESEPLPFTALRVCVPHPPGVREILLVWGVRWWGTQNSPSGS